MSKADKTLAKVLDPRQEGNVAFVDLCHLLVKLGYTLRQKGSHIPSQSRIPLTLSISSPTAAKRKPIKSGKSGLFCNAGKTTMKTTARDYEVNIRWSEADQVFIAGVVEMPGVMADGPTRADAAREIEAALQATIEAAEAHGHPLPEPRRLTPAA